MQWVVLILWCVTEASGAIMLTTFLRRGGLHDPGVATSYVAALFANFSLGTASIVLWILFLLTDVRALALAGFIQFLIVILIGTLLALPWHRARRHGHPTSRGGGNPAFAYYGIVEASHGILAWLTAVTAGVVAFTY